MLLKSAARSCGLWKELGERGCKRSIANGLRHVEEKLLATEEGEKGTEQMAKKVMGGKMRSTGVGAGGGIGNRAIKHSAAPKTEPRAKAVNVRGVCADRLVNGQSRRRRQRSPPARGGRAALRGQRLFDARWCEHQLAADQLRHVRDAGSAWRSGAGTTKPQGRDILPDFGAREQTNVEQRRTLQTMADNNHKLNPQHGSTWSSASPKRLGNSGAGAGNPGHTVVTKGTGPTR